MRTGRPELLAPAGSYEGVIAAASAGADAVYVGGSRFGARAYARNLSEEELLSAMDYLHIRGKQLHLTVNTLLKNRELEDLYEYIAPLYEHGLDAVMAMERIGKRLANEDIPYEPVMITPQVVQRESTAFAWHSL